MNRSILIVICDFLLVSLLAFSTVDINTAAQGSTPQMMNMEMPTNAPAVQNGGRQDLGDVMRLALAEERKNRETLLAELTQARGAINEREQQVAQVQQQLQAREQQAQMIEQEQTNLQRQVAAAREETALSQEQRTALEAQARQQQEKASALQSQLADLQKNNQAILGEKARLNEQLQLAETEKHAVTVELAKSEEEVSAQRAQNAKLSEGVKTLAANSTALTQEFRKSTPLAANQIYDDIAINHVTAVVSASRSGFFGQDISRRKELRTVLVSDGSRAFALCQVKDTPLALEYPATDWHEVDASLEHGRAAIHPDGLLFSTVDPRVALMPVTADQVRQLGCKVYKICAEPLRFPDAVVLGASQNYYGECKFYVDVTEPRYLKMDRSSLRALFGEFNPSSGDFVFSKSGELLGIMVNSVYCALIRDASATARLNLGAEGRDQGTAYALASLYNSLASLPPKLQ